MYSRSDVIEFIEKVFGSGQSAGNLNYAVMCPNSFCPSRLKNKKKFVIHVQTFGSHCWVCNIKSKNLFFILKKFFPTFLNEFKDTFLEGQELSYGDEDFGIDFPKELTLPKGFILLAELNENSHKEVFNYIKSRKLTIKDLWYYKLGISLEDEKYKNRIIIPSFDETGKLNFFTTRTYKKIKGPKYIHCDVEKTAIIFNELNIDWKEELTIVEGPFDLFKSNENATCMLGSTLDEKHMLFAKIVKEKTPVLLAFDDDAQTKMLKTALIFSKYGINVRIFKLPTNVHDVGEMQKEQFISNLSYAKIFSANDYLTYRIALL